MKPTKKLVREVGLEQQLRCRRLVGVSTARLEGLEAALEPLTVFRSVHAERVGHPTARPPVPAGLVPDLQDTAAHPRDGIDGQAEAAGRIRKAFTKLPLLTGGKRRASGDVAQIGAESTLIGVEGAAGMEARLG